MPRVQGVDIPGNKPIEYSLRSIFGIGPATAIAVLETAGIERTRRTHTLSEEELATIAKAITATKMRPEQTRTEDPAAGRQLHREGERGAEGDREVQRVAAGGLADDVQRGGSTGGARSGQPRAAPFDRPPQARPDRCAHAPRPFGLWLRRPAAGRAACHCQARPRAARYHAAGGQRRACPPPAAPFSPRSLAARGAGRLPSRRNFRRSVPCTELDGRPRRACSCARKST